MFSLLLKELIVYFYLTSKDYDLNVLCMFFIFELFNERNVLVDNGSNNN